MAAKMRFSFKKFVLSPYWPALMSALIAPGTGQIINREFRKGLFLLTASMGSLFWFFYVVENRLSLIMTGPPETWANDSQALKDALFKLGQETPGMFLIFQFLMIILWVFGIIDAFLTRKSKLKAFSNNNT